MGKRRKTVRRGRDALTGRFITIAQALRRSATALVQRIRVGRRRRP